MFKTKGGGVKGFLNNVQKNCGFGEGGHPLLNPLQVLTMFNKENKKRTKKTQRTKKNKKEPPTNKKNRKE